MTRALVPLSMSTIGLIPKCCRACVAWELEASAARLAAHAGEAEFEKEIWLSGVMLTWGSAGQIVTVDDEPVGFALFAPPTAVPGAAAFPTAPVSPDAVLLTTGRIEPAYRDQGLGRYLMEGVIRELTRRGVRAIELFGREGGPAPAAAPDALPDLSLADLLGTEHPVGEDDVPSCVLPAGFARAVGFTDVKPHHRYPRLRLELGRDLGWKAQVEAALEELFASVSIPASPPPAVRELVGAGTNRRRPNGRAATGGADPG
ncbi:GNAT family N-acetyltransferase [Nakamurella sp.]|uniref:GNAT family N-acetyltransferase n=1 Tax=Nakamurella sp. TaxID=1869182 RepID=UPI003B3A4CF8